MPTIDDLLRHLRRLSDNPLVDATFRGRYEGVEGLGALATVLAERLSAANADLGNEIALPYPWPVSADEGC